MSTIKILHTADNHLDPTLTMYRHKINERRKDFWNTFKYLLNYADQRKPDLFLISGDLYDKVNPRNPPRTQILKYFRHLHNKGIKIFLIGGHHDTPRSIEEGASPLDELAASGYVTYLPGINKPAVQHVKIKDLDICISGLTYNFNLNPGEDPLEKTKPKTEGDINILMLHYTIQGFTPTYMTNEPTVKTSNIPNEINYVAAGHLHEHKEKQRGKTLIAYPGSTERRSFLEEKTEKKGFLWIELNQEKTVNKEFIEVPTRPMKTLTYKITPNTKNPTTEIITYAFQHKNPELILRLQITGKVPLNILTQYQRNEILRKLLDHFFYIVIDDRDLIYKAEKFETIERLTPLKAFTDYMNQLIQKEKDPQRKRILELAKEIGIEKLEEAGAW
jgi:DNA repair exonuclease SbcCD nuclease subunit